MTCIMTYSSVAQGPVPPCAPDGCALSLHGVRGGVEAVDGVWKGVSLNAGGVR
jgi:hypothetical protein